MKTVDLMPLVRSTRPAPSSKGVTTGRFFAVLARAFLSCSPFMSGWICAMIAAAPATCGVAIEVPLSEV